MGDYITRLRAKIGHAKEETGIDVQSTNFFGILMEFTSRTRPGVRLRRSTPIAVASASAAFIATIAAAIVAATVSAAPQPARR